MSLSIAIMHMPDYPDRRANVILLQRVLQAQGLIPVIVKDIGHRGPWATARRAWLAGLAARDATHHMVLQDDALLCRNFVAGARQALAAVPAAAVSYYTSSHDLEPHKTRWMLTAATCGVCLSLPTRHVAEFLEWSDRHIDPAFTSDDVRVWAWKISKGELPYTTVPCLVQHLWRIGSCMGHRWSRARHFCLADPTTLDWTPTEANTFRRPPNQSLASYLKARGLPCLPSVSP